MLKPNEKPLQCQDPNTSIDKKKLMWMKTMKSNKNF